MKKQMTKTMKSLVRSEDGATAIEYGLIAALIAVAVIVVLTAIGVRLNTTFGRVRDALPT